MHGVANSGSDIFALALSCYRAPLAHQGQLAAAAPLPADMTRLLWLANGSPEVLESAIRQTGAKAEELCPAAQFLVQQLCFARGASYYRVLGLEPGATTERLKEHHRLLMRLFHPDRAGGESWTDHFASRVNEAWTALSRSQLRAADVVRRPPQSSVQVVVPAADGPTSPLSAMPVHASVRRWRKSGRSRVRFTTPRRWLPSLVLGGIALAALLAVWGVYETRLPITGPTLTASPVVAGLESFVDSADSSAIAALQAMPDWQALGQQESGDGSTPRTRLEQARRERRAADEALLEQMRTERSRLEEQLRAEQLRAEHAWSERLAAERAKLEQLKAEWIGVEQARSERLAIEQVKLEELQAEQVRAEQLAEAARIEREQIARAQLERAGVAPPRLTRSKPDRTAEFVGESRLAVAPSAETLTIQELEGLMKRYANAYRRADLDSLMALFATDARGKNGSSRDGIRRDYGMLFNAYWVRRMLLRDLRWTRGDGSASAVGRYEVWLRRRDNGGSIQLAGTIRFEVRKRDGWLSIVAIDYDWPRH